MKIDLNEDFEESFKAEAWRGFTGMEILCGVLAFVAAAVVVVFVWKLTDLPIDICVYFGIPVMIPIVGAGIYKYQGHSLFYLFREFRYFLKTRKLIYKAEEYQGKPRVFSMNNNEKKKKR